MCGQPAAHSFESDVIDNASQETEVFAVVNSMLTSSHIRDNGGVVDTERARQRPIANREFMFGYVMFVAVSIPFGRRAFPESMQSRCTWITIPYRANYRREESYVDTLMDNCRYLSMDRTVKALLQCRGVRVLQRMVRRILHARDRFVVMLHGPGGRGMVDISSIASTFLLSRQLASPNHSDDSQ